MKRIFCTFLFLSERATSYSTLRKIFSYAIYNVSKLLKYHISKIYVKTTLKVVLYKRWLYSNNSLNYRRRWRACKILATVCKKRFADTSKLSMINGFSRKNSTPPLPVEDIDFLEVHSLDFHWNLPWRSPWNFLLYCSDPSVCNKCNI